MKKPRVAPAAKAGGEARVVKQGGDQKKSAGASSDACLETVRELARIATEFDLAEVEIKPSGLVRVSRRVAGAIAPAVAVSHAPAPVSVAAPAASAPSAAAAASDDSVYVTSPFVGTFYRAPSPEAPVFVDVGQSVRKGQVVCIIEAMKLMNEIEAEAEGKVAEILVKNAEHVEFGQKLLRLTRA
jgi:acetyl-CoA carboxylase biotin carboxyl carrier protein